MTKHTPHTALLDGANLAQAARQSLRRLSFTYQARNPVMFLVFVGAIVATLLFGREFYQPGGEPLWFIGQIAFWLWFTVLFANLAEALAEGKGKAQADSLKKEISSGGGFSKRLKKAS